MCPYGDMCNLQVCVCACTSLRKPEEGMRAHRAGLQAVVSFNTWVLFTSKSSFQPLWINFCRGRVSDLFAVEFVSGN